MLDYGKVQQKTMLIAMTMASMTGSVFAGGINNTIDPAAAAEGAEAFGNGNTISATATSALVAGYKNVVDGDNAFAIGDKNKALGTNSIANGHSATADGEASIAIGRNASALGNSAVAQGNDTLADIPNSVAIGSNSVTDAAVGTSTIQDNASDIKFSNVTFAGSTPDSVVSFGANGRAGTSGVTTYTRQLQNVSAGRVSSTSTDAVNGSQLYDVALEAQKYNTIVAGDNITVTSQDNAHGRKEYTIGLSSDIVNRINSFSSNTNSLHNIINANQKEARKGIAGSAALAGLHPLDFDPDHKLDIMAGYGHYHNANAAAIGVAYRPNEDIMITVGSTANGGDDTVYNAGISYKWGAKSEVSRSKIAMARDLADAKREIAKLQADNEQFKAILNSVLGLNIQTDQNKDLKHN